MNARSNNAIIVRFKSIGNNENDAVSTWFESNLKFNVSDVHFMYDQTFVVKLGSSKDAAALVKTLSEHQDVDYAEVDQTIALD